MRAVHENKQNVPKDGIPTWLTLRFFQLLPENTPRSGEFSEVLAPGLKGLKTWDIASEAECHCVSYSKKKWKENVCREGKCWTETVNKITWNWNDLPVCHLGNSIPHKPAASIYMARIYIESVDPTTEKSGTNIKWCNAYICLENTNRKINRIFSDRF